MENETRKAFEKAWEELKAPVNETVTSKWYFKQGWQAAAASKQGAVPDDINEGNCWKVIQPIDKENDFELLWIRLAMVFNSPTDEIMCKNIARKVFLAYIAAPDMSEKV